MKKIYSLISFLFVFSLVAGIFCDTSYATDYSMEKCRQMIELGNEELSDKDLNAAKMYYRRAIQQNPYCNEAWAKYEELMKVISKNEPVDWSKLQIQKEEKEAEDPFAEFE